MTIRQPAVISLMLLASCTCGSTPSLDAKITDPWGKPVEGVEVLLNGEGNPARTSVEGLFSIRNLKTDTYKITASREGYLPENYTIAFDAEAEQQEPHHLEMYPEPETDGYHLVGPESYLKLIPEPVKRVGSEIKVYQGVQSSGEVEVDGKNLRVVFHTPLKMDQVARLDIELHRLAFVGQTEVGTVDGREEVDLNLWVSDGKIKYVREARGSDDNYLIRVEELASGTYAFSSMDLLDPKNDAFPTIAEAVRNVHVFTAK
jgi:hypothetical protein